MRKKAVKVLASLMCIMTAVAFMPATAFAESGTEIDVNVTVSNAGALVKCGKVTVTDTNSDMTGTYKPDGQGGYAKDDSYTGDDAVTVDTTGIDIGDVLEAADVDFEGTVGAYGYSIGKLCGDESGSYGYWTKAKNGSWTSAWSLADKVSGGDSVNAFVYADKTWWSDAFSFITDTSACGALNENVSLSVVKAGYDESWNTVFEPAAGAEICDADGEVLGTANDEGVAEIAFGTPGKYSVYAKGTGITVTAPCVVSVGDASDEEQYPETYLDSLKKAAAESITATDLSKYRLAEQLQILAIELQAQVDVAKATGAAEVGSIVDAAGAEISKITTDAQYRNCESYTKTAMKLSSVKAGKKAATAAWKKNTKFDSYQIYYKTSGKSAKYITVSKKTASKTIKSLASGKKYVFKIRGCKVLPNDSVKYGKNAGQKVYGAWSASKTVKVK